MYEIFSLDFLSQKKKRKKEEFHRGQYKFIVMTNDIRQNISKRYKLYEILVEKQNRVFFFLRKLMQEACLDVLKMIYTCNTILEFFFRGQECAVLSVKSTIR